LFTLRVDLTHSSPVNFRLICTPYQLGSFGPRLDALHNETFVGGESLDTFEDEFSRYIGTHYAVSVNSASSALLTFHALWIKSGDRGITSATLIATVNGST
jgi:hypothetical protein